MAAENNFGKRVLAALCRLFQVSRAWAARLFRTRIQAWKQSRAQKEMNKQVQELGAEVYAIYRQGESETIKTSSIAQQIKRVEESESQLFEIHDRIEAIDNEYRKKKQEIAESCKAGQEE